MGNTGRSQGQHSLDPSQTNTPTDYLLDGSSDDGPTIERLGAYFNGREGTGPLYLKQRCDYARSRPIWNSAVSSAFVMRFCWYQVKTHPDFSTMINP